MSVLALFLFDCSSLNNYKFTTEISEHLYIETYNVFGSGAYGGDVNVDVVTDSLTFRIIVGEYDDYDEFYTYKCNGDSLKVIFGRQVGRDSSKIISSKKKLISKLSQLDNISSEINKLPKIYQ